MASLLSILGRRRSGDTLATSLERCQQAPEAQEAAVSSWTSKAAAIVKLETPKEP